MTLVLNSRPRPLQCESFRGYLLRLTDINGYRSVTDVVRRTGIRYPLGDGAPWTLAARDLMKALESPLHMQSGELSSYFQSVVPSLTDLNDGQRRRIYRQNAALCPACVKASGFVAAWMDDAMLPICPIHRITLIQACPTCGATISHNRCDINACADCGTSFSQAKIQPVHNTDPSYMLVKQVYNGSISLKIIMGACDRMARPADFLPASPDYSDMPVKSVMKLQKQAAGLLFSRAFRKVYRDWLIEKHTGLKALGDDVAVYPLERFLRQYSIDSRPRPPTITFTGTEHYPASCDRTAEPVRKAKALGIEAHRLRSWARHIHSVDLSKQIASEQLSEILSISQSRLKNLADAKLLTAQNVVKTSRHLTFDVRDVADMLNRIPIESERPQDAVFLAELTPELKLFNADYADLMALVLAGRIPTSGGKGYRTFCVSREQAYRSLHDTLVSNKAQLTQQLIAGVWATSIKKIRHLEQNLQREIARESIESLMNKWVSLSRVSKVSGIRLNKLRRRLAEAGIEPVHEVLGNPQSLLLYRLSNEFRVAVLQGLAINTRYWGYY